MFRSLGDRRLFATGGPSVLWEYIGSTLDYLGKSLGIFWEYIEKTLGIPWEYFANPS